MLRSSVLLLAACAPATLALRLTLAQPAAAAVSRASPLQMGLFDMFQESEESKRKKDEALAAQMEIINKRRDPEAWEKEISQRRNRELCERAAKVGNLPDGWSMATDPATDRPYYYREGETPVWDPPIDEMVAILEEKQAEEMALGRPVPE